MDEQRKGEEELRRESAERPATDPRIDALGSAADGAWTATPRRAGSGTTSGAIGTSKRVSVGAQGGLSTNRNRRLPGAEDSMAAR